MATGELSGSQAVAPAASRGSVTTDKLPTRAHSRQSSKTAGNASANSFDVVATYRRILLEDPDITMPVAAIEALIELLGSTPATYRRILLEDPDITMPVAAIEALIELLGSTPATTSMETVDIMKAQAERLHGSVRNPIPLRAGTDLFQQYILRSLRGETGLSFEDARQHLLTNSKSFVDRAKEARHDIAARGTRLVIEGSTILTAGGSRTVNMLLLQAAERHTDTLGGPRFRVIYVTDGGGGGGGGGPTVAKLRERGVPVATVDVASTAHVLQAGRVDMVFVGSEVVVQNGGVLSRMGTYQLARLAKAMNIPLYVAAESHKIARVYPLGQGDLSRCGIDQNVLDFRTGDGGTGSGGDPTAADEFPVDYTPPELVTSIITEYGIRQPSTIYELLLDISA